MSLLKRLNAENNAAGAGQTGTGVMSGATPAQGTGGIGTGDLFPAKATGAMQPPVATGDLFNAPPRQTSTLTEQTQQATRARGGNTKQDAFNELKGRIQNRLIAELDPRMDLGNAEEVRRSVEETFGAVLESEGISLTRVERLRLFEAISAEILGFGPIEPLLKDASITEIMINGPKQGSAIELIGDSGVRAR